MDQKYIKVFKVNSGSIFLSILLMLETKFRIVYFFSVIDRLRKCWIETADFGGSHDRFYKISKPRQTCNEVSANCFNVYCCLFLLPMCDRLDHLISCQVTKIHPLLNAFCWILKPKLCSKLYIKQSANCGLFKGNNERKGKLLA